MPDLPRIPQRLTRPDLLIEVFCFIVLLESWTYTVYTYNHLPDTVYVFYKLSNGLGSRNAIWLFPILGSVIFIIISIICSFPHKLSYSQAVTKLNARRIYRKALRRLRVVKLILISVCGLGILVFAYFSRQELNDTKSTISIIGFILLVLPTIYLLYLVYSTRK